MDWPAGNARAGQRWMEGYFFCHRLVSTGKASRALKVLIELYVSPSLRVVVEAGPRVG
jgi:hypothetical protein